MVFAVEIFHLKAEPILFKAQSGDRRSIDQCELEHNESPL